MLAEARSRDYWGRLIPGDFMRDHLQRLLPVLTPTRVFFEESKRVAFISDGGWIAILARILRGRRATGSPGTSR